MISTELSSPFLSGKLVKVDCPIAEYLSSRGTEDKPILSRGDLCEIATNPRRWRNGYERPDDRAASKEFGSLFDCLTTQPHRLQEYYRMAPKTYETKKGEVKEWTWRSSTCRDWRDEIEAGGQLVVCEDDLAEARQALANLLADPEQGERTKRLLEGAQRQVFCIGEYEDRATGIKVAVRILTDLVPSPDDTDFGKCLFDLKTAANAHPHAWKNAVIEHDYHVQAALGLDIYTTATGEDRTDFRHIIVENVAPFASAYRFVPSELLDQGRRKYLGALQIYCQGVSTGFWPGYTDPTVLRIPADGYEACRVEPWMIQ